MSNFHSCIRSLLEDVHNFLSATLQHEALTSSALTQKESLLFNIANFNKEYPQLQLCLQSQQTTSGNVPDRQDSVQSFPSSPVPYVDMNSGIQTKTTSVGVASNVEEGYDSCFVKDRPISKETQSLTESDDTTDEGDKNCPIVAANDLFASEKSGYLEKKKRDTLKGWLSPFQKRWCAIKDGVMYYYEKSTDRRQKGSIPLSGYEARQIHELSKDGKKTNYCFELVCPGRRTYQFSAISENDLKQWISAVEQNSKMMITSGATIIQDPKRSKASATSMDDPLSYITEDIYETVEDIDDISTEQLPSKQHSPEDKTQSEKCSTDSESVKPQNQVFSPRDWYVGLWDCWGNDETELNFSRGDYIQIISKEYDSFAWWIGELQGRIGFVPKSYLMEAYESC